MPKAVLGDSAALLTAGVLVPVPAPAQAPPVEDRFVADPAGDSGGSGVVLRVLGLLDDRNLALADSVAAM